MATLTPQVVSVVGLTPTYTAAGASGDKVSCGERTFIHVKNASASSITVTLTATGSVRGQAVTSPTVSVPASGERMIGPLTADLFAGATDGLAAIGYSATATVTVAALRI
ncbi:hypothetical protein P3T27_006496 [Kitasatospora sp. MAA19]|uniref:hypothetical protein n=1 Tax=Kitasatospora sp. MAA19 TaxID=3035090 RepID=UPI002476DEB0|nr:hypothetical protein [Kitasatospora sp. MAA19]MDH6709747.1 hypothetical protein [Kitasatospora sp. MAA19]